VGWDIAEGIDHDLGRRGEEEGQLLSWGNGDSIYIFIASVRKVFVNHPSDM